MKLLRTTPRHPEVKTWNWLGFCVGILMAGWLTLAPAGASPARSTPENSAAWTIPADKRAIPPITIQRHSIGALAVRLRVERFSPALSVSLIAKRTGAEGASSSTALALTALLQQRLEGIGPSVHPACRRAGAHALVQLSGAWLEISLEGIAANLEPTLECLASASVQLDPTEIEIKGVEAKLEHERADRRSSALASGIDRFFAQLQPPTSAAGDSHAETNLDRMKALQMQLFRPDNVMLAVTSPLEAADVLPAVTTHFTAWKTTAIQPASAPFVPIQGASSTVLNRHEGTGKSIVTGRWINLESSVNRVAAEALVRLLDDTLKAQNKQAGAELIPWLNGFLFYAWSEGNSGAKLQEQMNIAFKRISPRSITEKQGRLGYARALSHALLSLPTVHAEVLVSAQNELYGGKPDVIFERLTLYRSPNVGALKRVATLMLAEKGRITVETIGHGF